MASIPYHFAFHQKVPHETCLIKFQHSPINVFTFERCSFRGFPSCSGSRHFAWCIIFIDCILFHVQSSGVQLDRYSPWSGPWGAIVNRGELLWNPTDFFVVGCWDRISYGEPLIDNSTDLSVDMLVVTRSTFDRYSKDARPSSNQCHYRYLVDITTDIYMYRLGNEGWFTFRKIHAQNPYADL